MSPSCTPQTDTGGLTRINCDTLSGGTVDAPLVVSSPTIVSGQLVVPPNSTVRFEGQNATMRIDGGLVLNSTVQLAPARGTLDPNADTEFPLFSATNITVGNQFSIDVDYEPARACQRTTSSNKQSGGSLSVVLTINSDQCKNSDSDSVPLWAWVMPLCVVIVCCVVTCAAVAIIAVCLYCGHCGWLKHPLMDDITDNDNIVMKTRLSA